MDSIKDIIPRVVEDMARSRDHRTGDPGALQRAWQDILEKSELKHTKLVGPRNGNLLVSVDSPAWLYHLRMRKAKILKKLREKMPEIKEITLKVGAHK